MHSLIFSLRLQTNPVRDSVEVVAPRCRPGYVDVTGGQAFYWSCAFHCEGGPYYAAASCMCACLTPEQMELAASQGGVGFGPAGVKQSSGILVTARTTIGPPPAGDPVVELPIGPVGEGGAEMLPPAVDGYIAAPQDVPAFQASGEPADEEGLSLVVVAFIGGALLIIAAATTLVCALWSSLTDGRRRRVKMVAVPPRFSPHVPVEKCPQPPPEFRPAPAAPTKSAVSLQEPPIRVSWTSSNASGGSKRQAPLAQPQLLQLPDGDRMLKGSPSLSKTSTGSGGASSISNVSSVSTCAMKKERQREPPQISKGRFGGHKCSRVYPGAEQVFM